MKRWIAPLAMAAALSAPALAQEAPPDGAMPPPELTDASGTAPTAADKQRFAAMRQVHEQMATMHAQMRAQMLGSLTPAHRTALANIIGQLAISPNPNPRAAAAQIDALLGAGEKQSILNAQTNERNASRSMMQSMRSQMLASLPADKRAEVEKRETERAAQRQQFEASHPHTFDAGMTLLRLSEGGGHERMGMMGGPGGPGMMGGRPDFVGRPRP